MTKQQIFSLYLANENQRVCNGDKSAIAYMYGLSKNPNRTWEISNDIEELFVEECCLMLKPIAEMSEEYEKELCTELVAYDFKLHEMLNFGGESATFKDNVTLIFWLITHGYALDDTWFTNGIAIKESK